MSGMYRVLSLLAGAAAGIVPAPAQAEVRTARLDHVLGTSLTMTAVGADASAAEAAFRAALQEIDRLDAVLSGWRDDSELAALNRSREWRASPDLYAVVAAAETWRERSGGAFDGRLGGVEALWRAAEADGAPPALSRLNQLASALEPVGLDAHSRLIRRPEPVTFALDGLAKGYVVDAALAAGRRTAPGLRGFMVDIGGDIAFWGASPAAGGWRIGAADPARPDASPILPAVRQGAVATSGRGARDREIGGRRYAALLSPVTGQACTTLSATVFASRAMDADALATALAVLPPAEGLALVARRPGTAALIVDADGRRHVTPGWGGFHGDAPRLIRAAAPAAAGGWPSGFAVTVDYEIPKVDKPPVYAPYVTIWITDESNSPVRQLLLLGDDQNFVDQNYIWWRRVGRSAPAVVDAVSRPTRKAGRHSVVWDGRDNAGRPVAQGRYTIHVEATREHGGHSYQTVQIQLGAQPLDAGAAGSEELGATRVRYGRRG